MKALDMYYFEHLLQLVFLATFVVLAHTYDDSNSTNITLSSTDNVSVSIFTYSTYVTTNTASMQNNSVFSISSQPKISTVNSFFITNTTRLRTGDSPLNTVTNSNQGTCCDDQSCSDNSECPCCNDGSCQDMTQCHCCMSNNCPDMTICQSTCCIDQDCFNMTQCTAECCSDLSCSDNSLCYPCCNDQSCTDLSVCVAPIPTYTCDPALQKNLAPIKFVIFQASEGDSLSLGDTAFLMARFPDGVCNMPDPGMLGDQCLPKIEVALRITANGKTQNGLVLDAARDLSTLQNDYNVQFSDQPEFLDQITSGFSYPWVFVLQVDAGVATPDLDVNWMQIPKACNRNITFNNTKLNFRAHELIPNVSIDTLPPNVAAVYSTAKAGNYTAGAFIDIVVKFSKDVDLSQLPDIYSQVCFVFAV